MYEFLYTAIGQAIAAYAPNAVFASLGNPLVMTGRGWPASRAGSPSVCCGALMRPSSPEGAVAVTSPAVLRKEACRAGGGTTPDRPADAGLRRARHALRFRLRRLVPTAPPPGDVRRRASASTSGERGGMTRVRVVLPLVVSVAASCRSCGRPASAAFSVLP